MTFSSNQSQNTNQLPISIAVNPDEKEYGNTLQSYLRRVANAVNTKTSGLYLLQETANFEQWFTTDPQQNRSAFRLTMDLVALHGAPIPAGASTVVLTTTTQPPLPSGYLLPVQGFGGAVDTTGVSYFPSDPKLIITFTSSTNTINITNNTGNALTWCVWVMEYLKN